MELSIIWFVLIAVLWIGYFVLEGFDYGVGMLVPVLGRDADPAVAERKRRQVLNTIGPVWDGNEVWLVTAGAATFATFPHWYAALFSGLYLPLTLALIALILRAVSIEYRGKGHTEAWRNGWTWCLAGGSELATACDLVYVAEDALRSFLDFNAALSVPGETGSSLNLDWSRVNWSAGFDLDLVDAVRREVSVPLIASGGAGAVEHFEPAVAHGADAVLAASVFHYGELTIGDVKGALAAAGHPVR